MMLTHLASRIFKLINGFWNNNVVASALFVRAYFSFGRNDIDFWYPFLLPVGMGIGHLWSSSVMLIICYYTDSCIVANGACLALQFLSESHQQPTAVGAPPKSKHSPRPLFSQRALGRGQSLKTTLHVRLILLRGGRRRPHAAVVPPWTTGTCLGMGSVSTGEVYPPSPSHMYTPSPPPPQRARIHLGSDN